MALPIVMFFLLTTITPTYANVFLGTPQGYVMMAAAAVLLTVGGLWLKRIIKPKF
jgi:tight adherence protein B